MARTPTRSSLLFVLGCAACSADRGEPLDSAVGEGLTGLVVSVVAGMAGLAGSGADGLPPDETVLYLPQDVTVASDGTWWIDDYNSHVVREVGADGLARIVLGSGFPAGGEGGPALEEPLDHPTMVLPDPSDPNVLWVAATGNHRIGRLDRAAEWIDFPYGSGERGFCGDEGPAEDACFFRPSSVAFDAASAMYVSDRMNQVVRRIADGVVTTWAGTPEVPGYSGDGGPADEGTLRAVHETDPGNRLDVRDERLVIADTDNHAIREVDLGTGIIRTLAGTGEAGFADDPDGTGGARFSAPHDVSIAEDGTVYVADTGNACVRAISPSGAVTTFAGTCGVAGPAVGEVLADEATFDFPAGVFAADDGSIWIADTHNHVIRRVAWTQ